MAVAAPIIMGVGGLLSAGTSIYSGIKQSEAIEKQAAFQAKQFEANSKIADIKASEAVTQGDKDANQVRRAGERLGSAQRASFAGQGVDVNSGTARNVQDNTNYMTEMDMARVKNNAWREAWGYKVEAANGIAQASFTRDAGANAARNTLIASGLNAGTSLFKTYGDMYSAGMFS